jgi:dimethylsulfone monooxygenase
VIAHNKLDLSQTVEANLGLSAQLVGDPASVKARLNAYEAAGVDLIILKFESMREDTTRFHDLVIANYVSERRLIAT